MMKKLFYLYFLLMFSVTLNLYGQGEWALLNKPTTRDLIKLHFLDNEQGWAAGELGVILKTTDGGYTWGEQTSNIDDNIIDIFMLNKNFGWALASFYDTTYGTIMLKTSNGGDTWEQEVFPEKFFYTVVFLDSLKGWLGGDFGTILGTTDGGSTWFQPIIDPGQGAQYAIQNFRFFSPQYGFAVGGKFDLGGVIWKTTNGGQRWTPKLIGPEPYFDMYFKDSLNVLGIGGDFDLGSRKVQTTDGGQTWEHLYLGIFGQARALSFRTETEAWAPLGFAGTYMYSLDGGGSWTDLYTPDSSAIYDLVFTDSLTGFAVGANGTVLKYTSPLVALSPESVIVSATPILYKNYPNPFNPTTTINFSLPEESRVTVQIYDITGKLIRTLVNEQRKPGHYTLHWDGRNDAGNAVASGIYFYRMVAGPPSGGSGQTFTQTRRMMMLK